MAEFDVVIAREMWEEQTVLADALFTGYPNPISLLCEPSCSASAGVPERPFEIRK